MKQSIVVGGAAALALVAGSATAQFTGPSTTTSPYLLPTGPQAGLISTTSVLTVGDSIGGYRMVGIPDGLGAFANPAGGSFTLVMNHELGSTSGTVRAHGQTGSFVSRWNIQNNLTVTSGRDHNTSSGDAYEYYTGTGSWSNTPDPSQRWNRFCSGDLAAPTAYFNPASGLGTTARIYLNGEEAGNEGRNYAHILTGPAANQTWQLPDLGKFSVENSVANPFAQNKTVVIGTDDATPGQVYVYVGNKTNTGSDIDRAGLTNGNLYGIQVAGAPLEGRAAPVSGAFSLSSFGNVRNTTGGALQTASVAANTTEFLRPEDGAWDPSSPNDFYFVTTDRFNNPGVQDGRSRLYRARFNDITNPTAGGQIDCLLDGTEGGNMFDNLCIDSHGRVLLQEDIGSNSPLGKIWLYDIASDGLIQIAQHDPTRFITGAPGFLTIDEESSGIFDAKDILGDGWFLMDVQAHYGIPGELVEGGQLVAMYVDPRVVPTPGGLALIALGGAIAGRRRRA